MNPSGDRFERAESALAEAERIFSGQIVDPRRKRMGQANALNERGVIADERGLLALQTGDPVAASRYHCEALRLLCHARELYDMPDDPDLIGRANAAKNLGVSYGCAREDGQERNRQRGRGGQGVRRVEAAPRARGARRTGAELGSGRRN